MGLTAIPVGYLCFARRTWSPRVVLWWNVAGILILLIIAYWPYILLPGFLVPLAWLGHAASVIQLRRS